jgi:protease II
MTTNNKTKEAMLEINLPEQTRVCRGPCGRRKPLEEFYFRDKAKNIKYYQCKECWDNRTVQWRLENPEKFNEAQEELSDFKDKAGFDRYMDIGDATPESFAKLGGWVADSISSTSQHLGSGGVSKQISATI